MRWQVTLTRNNTTISVEYSEGMGHFPNWDKIWGYGRPNGGLCVDFADALVRSLRFGKNYFSPGAGNTNHYGATKLPAPTLLDVLHCLLMDGSAIDAGGFSEWASEYGYDDDSISARKIYDTCIETGLKLRQMFGDVILAELQDFYQDY